MWMRSRSDCLPCSQHQLSSTRSLLAGKPSLPRPARIGLYGKHWAELGTVPAFVMSGKRYKKGFGAQAPSGDDIAYILSARVLVHPCSQWFASLRPFPERTGCRTFHKGIMPRSEACFPGFAAHTVFYFQ